MFNQKIYDRIFTNLISRTAFPRPSPVELVVARVYAGDVTVAS
jgi:hypothetical protein